MYLFLVNNSEHKKSKGINRNVVATIGHNEYNDVLLNNECIRYSMNIIQSKDHRIGAFGITKFNRLVLMIKYISKTMDTMD